MADDPLSSCTTCDAPVQRVFHPIAVHFKGSGFYATDYGRNKSGGSDDAKDKESSGDSSKGSSEGSEKSSKSEGSESKSKAGSSESKSSKSSKSN